MQTVLSKPNPKPAEEVRTNSSKDRQFQIDKLRREMEQIPRILLVRLRSLGDSILTLPLIEALHKWRPELSVDVLIESPFASVFSQHPAIHETLIMKNRHWPASDGWTRFRALLEIRKRSYPAVLNLHGGTTSRLFTIASGAGLRIGQQTHRASWIYNAPIPSSSIIWQKEALHTVEHQLTVMRWLGLPVPADLSGSLYVTEEARQRIQHRLAGIGISSYALIQPTATLETKQWAPQCFARLGDWLQVQHDLPVVFTAASHEHSVLREIRRESRADHVYWSDLPLMDLFALIEGCRIFIGNDSGPIHAASALKKPVVVVWGSSDFQAWHPWGTLYEAVRSDLPCIPCPGFACSVFEIPRCIRDIPVKRVADACTRLLRKQAEAR